MKIDRLTLDRYGHFEDRSLDLLGDGVRLHIVHGPNEAGKSTTLSAIADLLFGIPERSRYNFRHRYDQMRLSAAISDRQGRRLCFQRRKGRLNTLLDENGAALPDAALAPFLGGADRAFFERMFGLDHDRLRRGGEAMLESGGDLARSLFQAGSGLTGVMALLDRLEEDADAVASVRRSNRPLWQAVDRFSEAQKRIGLDSLRTEDWTNATRAQAQVEEEARAVALALADIRARRHRINRLRRVLPVLARLDALTAEHTALGAVPDLPDGFEDRWRAALDTARSTTEEHTRAARQVDEVRHALAACADPGPLPDAAAEIERLHLAGGDIAGKRADLPKLERDIALGRQRLATLIADLGAGFSPEDAGGRAPSLPLVAGVRERITQRAALDAALAAARRQHAAARDRTTEAEAALAAAAEAPTDPANAAAALAEADRLGDTITRLADARHALSLVRQERDAALSRLGLWTAGLEALITASFPDADSVSRQEQALAALAAERERTAQDRTATLALRDRLDGELLELTVTGTVPTSEAVAEARAARNHVWRQLRRCLTDGNRPDDPALADRFEETVGAADDLADRREREAQRINRFATLTRQRQDADRHVAAVDALRADCRDRAAHWERNWVALWAPSGLVPAAPAEMRAWLMRKEVVVRLADAARAAEAAVERAASDHERAAGHHRRAAAGLGMAADSDAASLRAHVAAAVDRRADIDRLRHDRDVRRNEVEAAAASLTEANNALAGWNDGWAKTMPALALAETASPAEAAAALGVWDKIRGEITEQQQTRRRLDGIQADLATHATAVAALVRRVDPALADVTDPDPLVRMGEALTRLRIAQSVVEQRRQLGIRLTTATHAATVAAQAAADAAHAVEGLRAAHGLGPDDDVVMLARAAAQARGLADAIAQTHQALEDAGDGLPEAALRLEALDCDPDSLAAEAAAVEEESQRLEDRGQETAQTLALAQQRVQALRTTQGSGEASWQAGDAARAMADHARHWMRLRAAALLLGRAVERYRSANEHPLLHRASVLLSAMAGTAANPIIRLAVNYDEGDRPVLLGMRRDGSPCPIGGMSDGTRDQLFLALRIAAVEGYAVEAEPLPFIADDLFITSDEERTVPGLLALAELGVHTQVVLFTHHRYVLDAARAALPADAVRVHGLAA